MAKKTINIAEKQHQRVRVYAAKHGLKIKFIISEAIEKYLSKK